MKIILIPKMIPIPKSSIFIPRKIGRYQKSIVEYKNVRLILNFHFISIILFKTPKNCKMVDKVLTEDQSANINKLLYALRVLHFPDIDDPTTHVEIKFVNASGVDQIIHCAGFEKLRNMPQNKLDDQPSTLEEATSAEDLEEALSSLSNLKF
jgi:hypothetical protein